MREFPYRLVATVHFSSVFERLQKLRLYKKLSQNLVPHFKN